MRRTFIYSFILSLTTLLSISNLATAPANAASSPTTLALSTISATISGSQENDDAKLSLIISRGDNEIARRIRTLNTLTSRISSANRLSSADKASLTSEVSDETTGLTSLKTQLDSASDLDSAKSSATSIFTEYRVYALIVPKVLLVRAADSQQATEDKLTDLANKMQSNADQAKSTGKNVDAWQSSIDEIRGDITNAKALSSAVESSVIDLQPNDYNTNRTILSGKRDQLKQAQTEIRDAIGDAKAIVAGMQKLDPQN